MMRNFKAVFFDAGGTLLYPHPSVGEIYQRVSSRFGCRASSAAIQNRFIECWKKEDGLSKLTSSCNEKIEKDWWRNLVQDVFQPFGGIQDFESFFEELYHTFASPDAWRVYPETHEVLSLLKARGKRLAVISNWDSRLFKLCETLGLDRHFEFVLASAVFGASKPSAKIFHEAMSRVGVEPSECVHIGDSYEDDVKGALSAGMQAVLLDRHGHHEDNSFPAAPFAKIQNLTQLLEL